MRKRPVILLSAFGIIVMLAASAWLYLRWKFPHGESHCCILNVMFALEAYAEEHEGHYPAGESSAEASLSLLHRAGHLDLYTLRGMTVPEETTPSILQGGGLLSADSCGCTVEEASIGPGFSSGTSSGGLDLVWYQAPFQEGDVTRTVSFSNLISDPVTITFTKGVPNVTRYVFRMRSAP